MAGASASSTRKGGIKAYWKHRGYDRLDAAAAQRRPALATAELGAGGGEATATAGRRRGWRVRRRGLGRRLLRALSPRRLLSRLRDAYVSAMLRLASSAAVGYGSAPFCAAPEPFARPRPLKEYEEKVLVEMYRSILARGGVIPLSGDASLVVSPAPLPATATVA
ncbi:uncharacterized protein LOC119276422 [Triticum dicoccoides]|uniref:uncharacterized protein LOC119276422 n=1 Tax=Triticum dicoccoides TaxID=85692 RepID=UPI0018905F69|nr:uncharacterized protein LOC119276422 [Triticum dicoccoides]